MSGYILNTQEQRNEMLSRIGAGSIEELFQDIPKNIRPKSFDIPGGKSEQDVCAEIRNLARKNSISPISFIGGGFYDHYIPAAIDALVSRSEFYTAYTPYQPELSQGTLQAIYEYQSHICRLTDMEVSNASLYDGGTALYEACQMAISYTGRRRILVDTSVSPIYRKMLVTYLANAAIVPEEIVADNFTTDRKKLFTKIDNSVAAVIVQNPNFFGIIDNFSDIADKCHSAGALIIQSTYPIALPLIQSPGSTGIDIATGEGQSLGIPLGFGGPYLGFMAVKKELARKMPGRIVGRTTDTKGREGFVLTLQAREQHIRREKATSNICSNEALCALRCHIYLSLLGKQGMEETASLCLNKAEYAKQLLKSIPGVKVYESSPTFNEFPIQLPKNANEIVKILLDKGFIAGFPLGKYYAGLENHLLVAVTEKRTKYEIESFAKALEKSL